MSHNMRPSEGLTQDMRAFEVEPASISFSFVKREAGQLHLVLPKDPAVAALHVTLRC
jgi:hypothetical protein